MVTSALLLWALYVFGDQPLVYDHRAYHIRAVRIAEVGIVEQTIQLGGNRTYGYPLLVSWAVTLVSPEPHTTRIAMATTQWLLLLAVCAFASRRIGRLLGDAAGWIAFAGSMLNPFVLIGIGMMMTEAPSSILICGAVALALPSSRQSTPTTVAPVLSIFAMAAATVIRPANLAVLAAMVAIWLARAVLRRDVVPAALAGALVVGALPFLPQMAANYAAYGIPHPLLASRDLYSEQLAWGVENLKYGTIVIDGMEPQLWYRNPFHPEGVDSPMAFLREAPLGYLLTLALHSFTLLDQDFPFTYIGDLDPWYRRPAGIVNWTYWLLAAWGFVVGLRRPPSGNARQALLVILTIVAAYVAVYLPTAVENRFALPLYLLVSPGLALGLLQIRAWVSGRDWRSVVGCLVVGILLVAGCLLLSEWVRWQAPVLRALSGA